MEYFGYGVCSVFGLYSLLQVDDVVVKLVMVLVCYSSNVQCKCNESVGQWQWWDQMATIN